MCIPTIVILVLGVSTLYLASQTYSARAWSREQTRYGLLASAALVVAMSLPIWLPNLLPLEHSYGSTAQEASSGFDLEYTMTPGAHRVGVRQVPFRASLTRDGWGFSDTDLSDADQTILSQAVNRTFGMTPLIHDATVSLVVHPNQPAQDAAKGTQYMVGEATESCALDATLHRNEAGQVYAADLHRMICDQGGRLTLVNPKSAP